MMKYELCLGQIHYFLEYRKECLKWLSCFPIKRLINYCIYPINKLILLFGEVSKQFRNEFQTRQCWPKSDHWCSLMVLFSIFTCNYLKVCFPLQTWEGDRQTDPLPGMCNEGLVRLSLLGNIGMRIRKK